MQPWLEVPLRAVPAYQHATLAVCAGLVAALAALARPLLTGWPWWLHAGLAVLIPTLTWLLVATVARLVWTRLVESLTTDTAHAIHAASPAAVPIEKTQQS
jgi:hypothetical protein